MQEGSYYVPLPTSSLPPNIKRPHSRIRQIQRGAPQTSHAMHHASLTSSPSNLSCHIHKTLHLAMQIPIRRIPSVLAPLTREDAFTRRVRRHGWDRGVADQRESTPLIQPGAAARTGWEELIHERGINDANYGAVVDDESDGDTKHREYVGVVNGA